MSYQAHIKDTEYKFNLTDSVSILESAISQGINLPYDRVKKLVEIGKGKSNFVKDIYDNVKYFFEAPTEYDTKFLRKKWKEDSPSTMIDLSTYLLKIIEGP